MIHFAEYQGRKCLAEVDGSDTVKVHFTDKISNVFYRNNESLKIFDVDDDDWSADLSGCKEGDWIATTVGGWKKVDQVASDDAQYVIILDNCTSYTREGFSSTNNKAPSAFTRPPKWLLSIIGPMPDPEPVPDLCETCGKERGDRKGIVAGVRLCASCFDVAKPFLYKMQEPARKKDRK